MAKVIVDPAATRFFVDATAFHDWLSNHWQDRDVWVLIHKKGSGLPSITPADGTRMAMCWGWIDGHRKGFDARSFLQRYSPRRRASPWSRLNAEESLRLIASGVMREPGRVALRAAIADGRWPAEVAPPANL